MFRKLDATLFYGLLLPRLSKTYTGAAAVLVDELDAAFLQGCPNPLYGRLASSQLAVDRFQTSYCGLRNTRFQRQVRLRPAQQRPPRLYLPYSYHAAAAL